MVHIQKIKTNLKTKRKSGEQILSRRKGKFKSVTLDCDTLMDFRSPPSSPSPSGKERQRIFNNGIYLFLAVLGLHPAQAFPYLRRGGLLILVTSDVVEHGL